MKIVATVVELDAEKWAAKGMAHRPLEGRAFIASWEPPGTLALYSKRCASKDEALDDLREVVRKYILSTSAKTIEDVELEL